MWVKLKHVKRVTAKGRTYWYHRVTGERLPDARDEREARVLAINATLTTERPKAGRGTVADLIGRYLASPEFQRLSRETRRGYRRHLDAVQDVWGQLPARGVEHKHVRKMRDTMLARDSGGRITGNTRNADYRVTVLRLLFNYGRIADRALFGSENPATDLRAVHKTEIGYPKWPDNVLTALLDWAYPELRWPLLGNLYLGQRSQDTLSLTWPQYDGETVSLTQRKTGKYLEIQAHPDLKAALDNEVARRGVVIFTTRTGRPWTVTWFEREVKRGMAAIGFSGFTPHGLRKNAVVNLLENGASIPETMAVTGQSEAMVNHYARQIDQRHMARSAIARLPRLANRGKGVENR